MDNKIVVIVKGIITLNNKVLILKRSKEDDIGAGRWEFVGGNIDFGEELEEALKREIIEETGLHIDIDKILYATTFKTDPSRQAVIIVYKCFTNSDDITLSEEHSEYKWVSKSELKKLLYKDILEDLYKYKVLPLIYKGE